MSKFRGVMKLAFQDFSRWLKECILPAIVIMAVLAVFLVAMNAIGWGIYHIAGENSTLSQFAFEDGFPSFGFVNYAGLPTLTLVAIGAIWVFIYGCKQQIIKIINYFKSLSRQVEE